MKGLNKVQLIGNLGADPGFKGYKTEEKEIKE